MVVLLESGSRKFILLLVTNITLCVTNITVCITRALPHMFDLKYRMFPTMNPPSRKKHYFSTSHYRPRLVPVLVFALTYGTTTAELLLKPTLRTRSIEQDVNPEDAVVGKNLNWILAMIIIFSRMVACQCFSIRGCDSPTD